MNIKIFVNAFVKVCRLYAGGVIRVLKMRFNKKKEEESFEPEVKTPESEKFDIEIPEYLIVDDTVRKTGILDTIAEIAKSQNGFAIHRVDPESKRIVGIIRMKRGDYPTKLVFNHYFEFVKFANMI